MPANKIFHKNMESLLLLRINFYPNVETELNQTIAYYKEFETGIDFDLAIEVLSVGKRIIFSPSA